MTKQANDNPGPGAHEATSYTKDHAKYGFGTSQRAALKKDTTPGPGSYEY